MRLNEIRECDTTQCWQVLIQEVFKTGVFKKKDRVFCLCAQSRENKKVKKCVKLKYGCCG